MSTININKTPIKIAIIGPQRVGKTTISNSLSEFSHVVSPDYHPTVGCRIWEFEKVYTDDQVKAINILKKSNTNKVKIELWDISGDKRYESVWPAIKYGAHGVIVVFDSSSTKYDNILDDWINNFCSDFDKNNIIAFSYSKDGSKPDNMLKTSNQFPQLQISEVSNDMNYLLPHFNKLVTKILLNLK